MTFGFGIQACFRVTSSIPPTTMLPFEGQKAITIPSITCINGKSESCRAYSSTHSDDTQHQSHSSGNVCTPSHRQRRPSGPYQLQNIAAKQSGPPFAQRSATNKQTNKHSKWPWDNYPPKHFVSSPQPQFLAISPRLSCKISKSDLPYHATEES